MNKTALETDLGKTPHNETDLRQQLLDAIERCGQTRYEIAKGAGITWKVLDQFMHKGSDVRLSTIQGLSNYFGMRFTKPRGRK